MVQYDTYVVDIALLDEGEEVIIEFNPYAVTTGAGLFQWKEETLKHLPTEIRMQEQEFQQTEMFSAIINETFQPPQNGTYEEICHAIAPENKFCVLQ